MGGLIAVLLAARMPQLVRSLVVLDPALPASARVARYPATAAVLALHALPGVGELLRRRRRRRIGARASVLESLHCAGSPDALPTELVERSGALADGRSDVAGTNRAFLSASRSLAWALARVIPVTRRWPRSRFPCCSYTVIATSWSRSPPRERSADADPPGTTLSWAE
jgi:pimeloyl-ACP methyl ester carboxylesterase